MPSNAVFEMFFVQDKKMPRLRGAFPAARITASIILSFAIPHLLLFPVFPVLPVVHLSSSYVSEDAYSPPLEKNHGEHGEHGGKGGIGF